MITNGFRRVAYLAAAVCFCVAAPLQAFAESDFDTVFGRYELTLAKVKAWEQATVAAAQALKGREKESEDDDDDDDAGVNTIDDIAAQLDAVPEYRRAIHQARLSTRDFVTIGLVLFQSMAMDEALKLNPGAELPKSMNPANLKFVRAHKAELEASVKAVQAVSSVR